MNLCTSWLTLLIPYVLFQSDSNGFATSAHWNHRNIGDSGRTATAATSIKSKGTTSWGRSQHSRTAFIQSEETTMTTKHTESSDGDETAQAVDHDANIDKSHSSVNGDAIQVSAAIELPFPKSVAYDAFSDLSRQSSYSPWLKSVEYIEGERNTVGSKTRWRLSYLGLRFTWNSISTLQDPKNGIIEWESITGLQNSGRVTFQELSDNRTHMNMTMSFAVPRIAARLLGPHKLASIVEKRILETTVRNFRQIVVENDWKMIQGQQQLYHRQPMPNSSVTNAVLTSPIVTPTCEGLRK